MGEEAADHVGIIGAGNMGGMMALLFQERGCSVSIIDVAKDALAGVSKMASKAKTVEASQIQTFDDMAEFTKSFPSNKPRVIVFSLPHGSTTDSVIDQLEPHLAAGDILLDCGNEWWQDTERRQKRTSSKSFGQGPIDYIGCGVSGGYQAARHGPSMSPGGERAAYDKVEQLLKKFACKSKDGSPCVAYMGKGGAGHHVKCLHNGIEQGILSAVAEVYSILRSALGLSNDQIADVFKSWDEHGGLQGNFLVDLASELPKFKEGDAIQAGQGIVDDIKDKVRFCLWLGRPSLTATAGRARRRRFRRHWLLDHARVWHPTRRCAHSGGGPLPSAHFGRQGAAFESQQGDAPRRTFPPAQLG
jgi:6-phosphogluconate dehydrogenase